MTITNDYIAQQILEGVTANKADVIRMRNDGRTAIPKQFVADREKTRALTAILRSLGYAHGILFALNELGVKIPGVNERPQTEVTGQ